MTSRNRQADNRARPLTAVLAGALFRRQWLPERLRRSLYKVASRRGPGPDYPFSIDFFGLRYEGNLRNNIDFSIYFYGAFEKPLLFFMRDALQSTAGQRSRRVFADIGANIGQHSLFMSRYASAVHAFEPYAPVRQRLEHQIGLNQLTNIEVYPFGLSNENGRLPFFAPTGHNLGIGSFDPGSRDKGNRDIGELELRQGDAFFSERGIEGLDLVKIDVEGFEKSVLEGLRETLKRDRPLVVCEITYGRELSFASAEEVLSHLPPGYRLFSFDNRKPDGSKARRRQSRRRLSGEYRLLPHERWLSRGQDDIIACPEEKLSSLPRGKRVP